MPFKKLFRLIEIIIGSNNIEIVDIDIKFHVLM